MLILINGCKCNLIIEIQFLECWVIIPNLFTKIADIFWNLYFLINQAEKNPIMKWHFSDKVEWVRRDFLEFLLFCGENLLDYPKNVMALKWRNLMSKKNFPWFICYFGWKSLIIFQWGVFFQFLFQNRRFLWIFLKCCFFC